MAKISHGREVYILEVTQRKPHAFAVFRSEFPGVESRMSLLSSADMRAIAQTFTEAADKLEPFEIEYADRVADAEMPE